MATYNKFNLMTQNLVKAVMNFNSDTVKVALSNTLPVATNAVFADITEISAGNGYSAGGTASSISIANSSGVEKVTATDVVFTASGGTIGPFRYIVVYDDTPTSPADPLIAWFDYGSAITLNSGDTFTVDFDGTNGLFTVT
jgi:hypothetical protein